MPMLLPDVLEVFIKEFEISFKAVPGSCTSEQISSWMADRRSKLMKTMAQYERSGNGDNQHGMEHVDDDCKDYLGSNKSTILYFWELADRFDILKSTMAEVDQEQIATTERISLALKPTAVHANRKRKTFDISEDALAKIGNGIESIASSSTVDSLIQVIRSCEAVLEPNTNFL